MKYKQNNIMAGMMIIGFDHSIALAECVYKFEEGAVFTWVCVVYIVNAHLTRFHPSIDRVFQRSQPTTSINIINMY